MADAPPERQPTLVEMDDETLVATTRLMAATINVVPVEGSAMGELLNELADRIEDPR